MEERLAEVWQSVWTMLAAGRDSRRHPFHTPALATIAAQGFPEVRTVILRYVDPESGEIGAQADARSEKIGSILAEPRVEWHFYSPDEKRQVRARGVCHLHQQDDLARAAWQKVAALSRRCYLSTIAPGERTDDWTPGFDAEWANREPTWEESEAGFAHFVVIRTRLHWVDVLDLEFTGHRRSQFERRDNVWHGFYAAP
ncbi:MAG: pyridoxamine 5'-phosphate oxidase family protein [Fimbriimonadaceae bacterium]|nr:pyridoxamine 5'-phosphate oxidase family protein [Fimbriimonadaceae bacterium]